MSASHRILCVEDNEALIAFLKAALSKRRGFEVDGCRTLEETFEKLDHSKYDVILLDLNLFDSAGVSTLVEVTHRTDTPIVVYSGHAELKEICLEHGAADFLCKPRSQTDIAKALAEAANIQAGSISEIKEEIETRAQGEDIKKPIAAYLTNFSLNVMCLTFALGVVLDMYFQVRTTGKWQPTDWEVTCWTAALSMRGIYEIHKKAK